MTETHMRREVLEIPEAAARLLSREGQALAAAGAHLARIAPPVICTVARGSSDHAAGFLKYAIEIAAGVPVASVGPSVASIYGARLRLSGAACIAISQSGKSPDIVALAEEARAGGALTLALTNTGGSPLALASHHAIDIAAGPERSVAATKSFLNSIVAGLAILGHWTADRALLEALERLPEALARAVALDWSPLGEALGGTSSLFILGRGPAFALASEAALKLKETCGMHAEAYSAAEVMHGPLALVHDGFPVLLLAARDRAEPSLAEAAQRLQAQGARVLATSDAVPEALRLPFAATGHPLTDPLPLIAAFYAFVEGHARARGLDPDRPRNLAKVTETV